MHHLLIKSKVKILSVSTICYVVGHKLKDDVDNVDSGAVLSSLYKGIGYCIFYPNIVHIMHQLFSTRQGTWASRLKRRTGIPKIHPTDHISTPVE
jgi:hypothetical protein